MGGLGAIHDVWQQPFFGQEAQSLEHPVIVSPRAEIAKGKNRLARACGACCRQVQIEPVLAMKRGIRRFDHLGRGFLHMGKLGAHLTSIEPCSGNAKTRTIRRAPAFPFHHGRGAGIKPKPGFGHRAIIPVDQPGTVALPRDGDSGSPCGKIIDLLAQISQGSGAIRPGIVHGLNRCTVGTCLIPVRYRSHSDLISRQIEGNRLDHRCSGVDADQDIAVRRHHASSRPWLIAMPVSGSKM